MSSCTVSVLPPIQSHTANPLSVWIAQARSSGVIGLGPKDTWEKLVWSTRPSRSQLDAAGGADKALSIDVGSGDHRWSLLAVLCQGPKQQEEQLLRLQEIHMDESPVDLSTDVPTLQIIIDRYIRLIAWLITEAGADICYQNSHPADGRTPLHVAIDAGFLSGAQVLLRSAPSDRLSTCFQTLDSQGRTPFGCILRSFNTDLEIQLTNGFQPRLDESPIVLTATEDERARIIISAPLPPIGHHTTEVEVLDVDYSRYMKTGEFPVAQTLRYLSPAFHPLSLRLPLHIQTADSRWREGAASWIEGRNATTPSRQFEQHAQQFGVQLASHLHTLCLPISPLALAAAHELLCLRGQWCSLLVSELVWFGAHQAMSAASLDKLIQQISGVQLGTLTTSLAGPGSSDTSFGRYLPSLIRVQKNHPWFRTISSSASANSASSSSSSSSSASSFVPSPFAPQLSGLIHGLQRRSIRARYLALIMRPREATPNGGKFLGISAQVVQWRVEPFL